MPKTKRSGLNEYKKKHIENAIFFDLDKNSKKINLPHMLTTKNSWEKIVSKMGINNKDKIIIYDNSDIFSACRCWYNFIYFGHNPSLVHVLDGGFKKWKLEKRKITKEKFNYPKTNYKASENLDLIKNKNQINKNIYKKKFLVVDARSKERFEGIEAEPRKDVKSGSIPNSLCLPFKDVINEDHTFKKPDQILSKFNDLLGSNDNKEIVFSCGSGVTAAVLALAYSLINNKYKPSIYDGSWAEYGKI